MAYDKDKLNDLVRVLAISALHSDMAEGHYNSISNREAIDRALKGVRRHADALGVEINPEDIDSDYLNKHLDDARIWL